MQLRSPFATCTWLAIRYLLQEGTGEMHKEASQA
jgi:hypothetical protein